MTLGPYAYQILGTIGSLAAVGGGSWAYRRRVQVDMQAAKEKAALDAQSEPIRILSEQLAKREADLKEAHAEARSDRMQFYGGIEAMKSGIDALKMGIDAIVKRLDASTAESSANAKVTNERLLIIETTLGITRKP